MITIDALCEALGVGHVGLLKIDTEGAEPIVVRGARNSISEGRIQCILMEFIVEFMEDMGEDPYMFGDELEDMGFALHGIEPDGSLGKRLDTKTVVDERRVTADAPLRSFEGIDLVAVLRG